MVARRVGEPARHGAPNKLASESSFLYWNINAWSRISAGLVSGASLKQLGAIFTPFMVVGLTFWRTGNSDELVRWDRISVVVLGEKKKEKSPDVAESAVERETLVLMLRPHGCVPTVSEVDLLLRAHVRVDDRVSCLENDLYERDSLKGFSKGAEDDEQDTFFIQCMEIKGRSPAVPAKYHRERERTGRVTVKARLLRFSFWDVGGRHLSA